MKSTEKQKSSSKVQVITFTDEYIEFENGYQLEYYHDQDCCEQHYLLFADLTMEDFDGLVFDLSEDTFFERIEGYGIALKPIYGHSIKIPGYASNNGYYSDDLSLFLLKDGITIKEYDITACQEYRD